MTTRRQATISGAVGLLGWLLLVMPVPQIAFLPVNAQNPDLVRKLDMEMVPEEGCPVILTSGRTELDMDAFGVPMAARIYLDYRNQSDKPVSAVKFRIRYTDAEDKDRGTFHAPDAAYLAPGASGTQKWRSERVDPRATHLKVRVLAVKYGDGGIWESDKTKQLAKPGAATELPETQAESAPGAGAPEQAPGVAPPAQAPGASGNAPQGAPESPVSGSP